MFLSLKHNPWEKFHAVFSEYHSYTSMINTAQLMNSQTLMQLKCAASVHWMKRSNSRY